MGKGSGEGFVRLLTLPGVPSCGKGDFIEALQQLEYWEHNGSQFPGVLDASQMESLDGLLSVYNNEAVILFDFAQYIKGSLGQARYQRLPKMLEELTDYGRRFNIRGWGRLAGRSVIKW